MANFAELDENNIVKNVIVVDNSILLDDYGNEIEEKGINFLLEHYGHSNWKQTSINKKFRKNYAGIGYTYDQERDAFIPPKPEGYNSFILDEETCIYEPPVPKPNDSEFRYYWSEQELAWKIDSSYEKDPETGDWRLK